MDLLQLLSPSLSSYIVFPFSSKVEVLISLLVFLQFYSLVCGDGKVHISENSPFSVDNQLVWSSGRDEVMCMSTSQTILCVLFLKWIPGFEYTTWIYTCIKDITKGRTVYLCAFFKKINISCPIMNLTLTFFLAAAPGSFPIEKSQYISTT